MATLRWIGNAADVAQEAVVEVENVGVGDKFKITCNNKFVEIESTDATVAEIIDGFVTAFSVSTIAPELYELDAEAFTDTLDGVYKLRLTAKVAGKPFTISVSATNASEFGVQVTTLQNGSAGTNEVKTVELAGVPTGGTFTLTFGGQTTAAQAFNESAANLEADLEALSSIGAGQVAVTRTGSGISGDPYIWTIAFQGTLAATNVGAMTGSGASLTGAGEIDHQTLQDGGNSANEIQTITQPTADSGTFKLTYQGVGTGATINTGCSAATMASSLIDFFGADVAVTRATSGADYVYTLTWTGFYAGTDIDELTTTVETGTVTNTHATTQNGQPGAPQNEIQRYTIRNGVTGGTYTLTYDGATTAAIAYNASAATVVTELEAIAGIGVGDVAVTKFGSGTVADPYIYEIEFQGALALTDVSQLTSTPTSLTGAEVLIVTTTEGNAGQNEIQQVEITGGTPGGGTFTLANDYGAGTETTAGIAYNASATTLRQALEALATPVPGDFAVTGSAGGPWTVTYQGTLDSTDFADFTGNGASLTGGGTQTITLTATVTSTGKHYWDNAANWDGGTVPVNADIVWIENSDVGIWYGLAQSAVTLAALNIDLSFTGTIGLPDYTDSGYYEYRAKELAIGATLQNWGSGVGSGSSLIRINNGTVQTTGVQYASGASDDPTVAANRWRGTHAANAWTVLAGEFSGAGPGGQLSNLATFEMGSPDADDPGEGLFCEIGDGVTLTTLTVQGGTLELYCTVGGNLRLTGGVINTYRAAAITGTSTIAGGRLNHLSSGELTGAVDISAGGHLDFSQDPRGRTVAGQLTGHAGSILDDRHRTVAWTSPPRLHKCGLQDVSWNLGRGLQLTVTNI